MTGSMSVARTEVFREIYEVSASTAKGAYEGQVAELHKNSKSVMQVAQEMDDYVTDTRVSQSKVIDKDIKDKKRALARRTLLTFRVNKLDKNRGSKPYSEYEQKMQRLKGRVLMQKKYPSRDDQGGKIPAKRDDVDSLRELDLSALTNPEALSEYILTNISSSFDDVTEQDNALEYLIDLEQFDRESNVSELTQCKARLLRLEADSNIDSKVREEQSQEINKKIASLSEQIEGSSFFEESLVAAQSKLRGQHLREIEDGYNLIPKAADLMKSPMMVGGGTMHAVDIAVMYRDSLLSTNSVPEAMDQIAAICEFGMKATPSLIGSEATTPRMPTTPAA